MSNYEARRSWDNLTHDEGDSSKSSGQLIEEIGGTMVRRHIQRPPGTVRAHGRNLLQAPDRVLHLVLAGCILLFLAVPLLLYEASTGISLVRSQESPQVVSTWEQFDVQQQCIRDAITRAVPRNANVFVSPNQSQYDAGRLVELSTPWVKLVNDRDRATYSLKLVKGSECNGESIAVNVVR